VKNIQIAALALLIKDVIGQMIQQRLLNARHFLVQGIVQLVEIHLYAHHLPIAVHVLIMVATGTRR
jgi:hypothetical protein